MPPKSSKSNQQSSVKEHPVKELLNFVVLVDKVDKSKDEAGFLVHWGDDTISPNRASKHNFDKPENKSELEQFVLKLLKNEPKRVFESVIRQYLRSCGIDEEALRAKVVRKQNGHRAESEEEDEKDSSSDSHSPTNPKTLADAGYYFNEEGKLRDIKRDHPFKFKGKENYELIGNLVTLHVNGLMEELGLEKRKIKLDDSHRFFYASPRYEQKQRVLVLIHGSGAVRGGQWARSLIINESLSRGAMIDYIHRGLSIGWGIVVLNYNEDCIGCEGDECHSPIYHGVHEWKHAIRNKIAEILVVAHSYGGSVISKVIRKMHDNMDYRVLCVALTDSHFTEGRNVLAVNFNTDRKKMHKDNDTYQIYSGDDTHEGTSSSCINGVFSVLQAVDSDTTEDEFRQYVKKSEKIILEDMTDKEDNSDEGDAESSENDVEKKSDKKVEKKSKKETKGKSIVDAMAKVRLSTKPKASKKSQSKPKTAKTPKKSETKPETAKNAKKSKVTKKKTALSMKSKKGMKNAPKSTKKH